MTVVVARLQARPERVAELAESLAALAEQTRKEPGALGYAVCGLDDGEFLVVERYADRAACDGHFAAAYVTELLGRFPELLLTDPQVEIADPLAGFHR
ncbi:putative quinol monooxygenase [Kitasatospora sp. CM 4170]|uniref:Quinol monooxygenase n=1 Tax=Kitasatospora aburaviensis TaxID=67265 RepID=A0ABW1EVD8_9ACTN|nr:putative quinol monooxygenase [Kitasatospora sp. CM 4170]WNM43708.1 putative quinol monooxygenase [Kitasatospora sp. CM 4170]